MQLDKPVPTQKPRQLTVDEAAALSVIFQFTITARSNRFGLIEKNNRLFLVETERTPYLAQKTYHAIP